MDCYSCFIHIFYYSYECCGSFILNNIETCLKEENALRNGSYHYSKPTCKIGTKTLTRCCTFSRKLLLLILMTKGTHVIQHQPGNAAPHGTIALVHLLNQTGLCH